MGSMGSKIDCCKKCNFIKVCGLSLACCNVLILPLDVANQRGTFIASGDLPMQYISLISFILTVVFGVLLVPFTMYYYEGLDDEDEYGGSYVMIINFSNAFKQFVYAFKWTFVTLVIFALMDSLLYWKYGFANIPTIEYHSGFRDLSTTKAFLNNAFCTDDLIVNKIENANL